MHVPVCIVGILAGLFYLFLGCVGRAWSMVLGSLLSIGGAIWALAAGGGLAVVVCIVGVLIAALPLFISDYKTTHGVSKQESLEYMTFDAKKKTISIKKRGSALRSIIHIQEVREREKEYTPEKLHFGAVTVGGVTTGGTYKTGGVYNGKEVSTGRYALVYKGIRIEKIDLPPELAEEAKGSGIEQYLDRSGAIKVVGDIQMDVSDMRALQVLEQTHQGAYEIMLQKLGWTRYPTEEKCREIMDWLSQE